MVVQNGLGSGPRYSLSTDYRSMERLETREDLATALLTNQRLLERAIVAIYERQTQDEQRDRSTKHHNGRGFTPADAKRGTRLARWILGGITKYNRPYGQNLTGHHLELAREIMPKYARQLLRIMRERSEQERMENG